MNVLIISNYAAGLLNLRRELIEELVKVANVTVCVPLDEYSDSITEYGVKLVGVKLERRGKNPINELSLIKEYGRIIKGYSPDVVLTYTIKPNIYGGIVCRLMRVPYIANITGFGTELQGASLSSKALMCLYAYSVRKAKKVFVQNIAILRRLKKHHVSSNCELLPGSGVNLTKHCFEKYPSEEDGVRFLYIGRMMKDKGSDELLYAAEKIAKANHNVYFDVIGLCEEDKYVNTINKLARSGIMKIYPFQDNIHDVIKDHHCIIHPSYHEGMSNALLEAAAVGRPVIASNISGCKETFDDGISGFSVEARDKEDLILGINKFLNMSPEEHARMGAAGRKKMETSFDRQIIVQKYLHIIKDIEGEIKNASVRKVSK